MSLSEAPVKSQEGESSFGHDAEDSVKGFKTGADEGGKLYLHDFTMRVTSESLRVCYSNHVALACAEVR